MTYQRYGQIDTMAIQNIFDIYETKNVLKIQFSKISKGHRKYRSLTQQDTN